MFAALNIYKPVGMTSHDVISRLRRIFSLKRIGHLGTLDPLAEGVLPVCLGQATRLIEYFPTDKKYRALITLGFTTTTLDAEGDRLNETDCTGIDLSPDRLETILSAFRGVIQQEVPLYSAVHVKGKKLYELARAGQTADLPVRETTIHALTLGSVNSELPAHPVLTIDVHCASGTYIRSLARDIGSALGCGAYMSGLVRTQHGHFTDSDAVSLETLADAADPVQFFIDPLPLLAISRLTLFHPEEASILRNGVKVIPRNADGTLVKLKPNAFYLAQTADSPVGVVQAVSGHLKAVKILAEFAPTPMKTPVA